MIFYLTYGINLALVSIKLSSYVVNLSLHYCLGRLILVGDSIFLEVAIIH